jgi:hypothetical protein
MSSLSARWANPVDRRALFWRLLWSPFWIWSDTPMPVLSEREPRLPAKIGLAGQAVVSGIDRVRRRLWLSHAAAAICRGVLLGLLFAALLMLLDVVGGPSFSPRPAIAAGALFLGAGVILAAMSRPSRQVTARVLDRSFGLHERLTTALDDLGLGVPAAGERARVIYLQMADAANAVAVLRNDRRLRPTIPVREVVLIVLVGLILATLAFVRGLGGGLPELAVARVPPFTPAIELPAEPEPSEAEVQAAAAPPTVQDVLERADRSSRARRDLQLLAKALADHAVTRPAAEQIAGGDYGAASDQLREAAAQSGDLSQTARETLANDLQGASNQMEPETSGLQEASRDASAGLRQGEEPAREGMRSLADAVETAGEQVVPQGELASQMRSAQQSQSQGGGSESQPGSESSSDTSGDPSAQFSPSGEPGSGIDASTSTSAEMTSQQGEQGEGARSGTNPGEAGGEQPSGGAESGEANAPGNGEQAGEGGRGAPGEAGQSGDSSSLQGEGESTTSQQGAGAGTGASADISGEQAGSSGGNDAVSAGEPPAPPNVSIGGDEADPTALDAANDRIALPTGSGEQGVQTSSDGGSALRGSGAGVTAGSGYAVQGEVGEAGPDSNRVPPQHRDTVERYFSSGVNE